MQESKEGASVAKQMSPGEGMGGGCWHEGVPGYFLQLSVREGLRRGGRIRGVSCEESPALFWHAGQLYADLVGAHMST